MPRLTLCGVEITRARARRPVFANDVFEGRRFGPGIEKAFADHQINLDDPQRLGFVAVVVSILKNWEFYAGTNDALLKRRFEIWAAARLECYPGTGPKKGGVWHD